MVSAPLPNPALVPRGGSYAAPDCSIDTLRGVRCRWSVVKAVGLSFFLTFIPFFDIPVFWPILVIYFFALCFMTMRRQIAHMWKHKYIPFDIGKKQYKVRADSSDEGRLAC